MINENEPIDGSWELKISIPDINEFVSVRVKGDIHIGGVMHKAVDKLQQKQDWSDYMLWWTDKNIWLSHTRTTLDQYGVQSDCNLELIKVHNDLNLILPSLQTVSVPVNFSVDIFTVVIRICRELCIRFPEELSLQLPLTKDGLKSNQPLSLIKNKINKPLPEKKTPQKELPTPEPLSPNNSNTLRYNTLNSSYGGTLTPYTTLNKSLSSQIPVQSCNSLSYEGIEILKYSECMKISTKSVFDSFMVVQPKNIQQKARLNSTWLDSSRSLQEQGINKDMKHALYLRFKFSANYDLNVKYDTVRIHQLFEQAKWDLLSGRLDVTEDEMVLFSALQLQAELRTENAANGSESPSKDELDSNGLNNGLGTINPSNIGTLNSSNVDEVDVMLTQLEEMCLGDTANGEGVTFQEPRLEGSLRVCRTNKLGIKSQKRLWCVLKKQNLILYPSKEEVNQVVLDLNVPTAHIKPDVNVSSNKFFLKLSASSNKEEFRLQFDNKDDYANWVAAIRLICRRKTLTNKTLFQKEIDNIMEVLKLQTPGPQPVLTKQELSVKLKELADYMPDKVIRKAKSKDYLRVRIGESHANVRDLSLIDAKFKYVNAAQRLENYGMNYFLVKFDDNTKEELVGISSNRFCRLNMNTGDVISTHYFSEMKAWNINWDAEKVILDFKDRKLVFRPTSSNCKTIVEFIGGYIFLNQRNPDKSQDLNVKLFHKLTGAIN